MHPSTTSSPIFYAALTIFLIAVLQFPEMAFANPGLQCNSMFLNDINRIQNLKGPFLKSRKLIAGKTLIHVVRNDFTDLWVANFRQWLLNGNSLNGRWPETSEMGCIFTCTRQTFIHARNSGSGDIRVRDSYANGVVVLIQLRPEYGFYELGNLKQIEFWTNWLKRNPNRINKFSAKQVQLLQEKEQPYHSEFYSDYRLAGIMYDISVYNSDLKGADAYYWMLTDMNAIESIQIQRAPIAELNRNYSLTNGVLNPTEPTKSLIASPL